MFKLLKKIKNIKIDEMKKDSSSVINNNIFLIVDDEYMEKIEEKKEEEKKKEVKVIKKDNKTFVMKKVVTDIDFNQGRWRDRIYIANKNRRKVLGIEELERRQREAETNYNHSIRVGTLAKQISDWLEKEVESGDTVNAVGIEIQIDNSFNDIVDEVFSMPRFASYEIIRYKENELRNKTGFNDCSMWLIKASGLINNQKSNKEDDEFLAFQKALTNQYEVLEKELDIYERKQKLQDIKNQFDYEMFENKII